jgi:hypothetical protein
MLKFSVAIQLFVSSQTANRKVVCEDTDNGIKYNKTAHPFVCEDINKGVQSINL